MELTQLGEDQLSDQYNVKLNAGSDEIDVMMYRPLQEGKAFAKNGYLADLTDKVSSDSGWDWKDFQDGPVKATTYDGKVVGVPIITEREVLYYRKDLLQAAGLQVPKTMEELEGGRQGHQGVQPRRRRLRGPHRQVRGRYPVLQLPVQLRRRLHRLQRKVRRQLGRGQEGLRILRRPHQELRPGQRQHRHELARGHGNLHPGQGRLLHRG